MLQPQAVRAAVHEIARLVTVGWIDEPTEDMVGRIKDVCQAGQCNDVWDELQNEKHPLLKIKKRRGSQSKSRKRRVAQRA
jgi:hypothetical protein